MKFVIAATIFITALNSVSSQTNKVKMAFIGNSITAGVYDYKKSDIKESYATKFAKLMQEVYGDTLETYNAGVSGRTLTKHGPAPIWNEDVFEKALKYQPDICLIALGTNDSKPSLFDMVQKEFYNDYQNMIDTFKSVNPDIVFIVCLPPPIWEGHPYSPKDPHNDTLLVKYTIPLIDSIAERNDLLVVDFHTAFIGKIQYFTDKLHPNPEGSREMAKILYDRFLQEDLIHKKLQIKDSVIIYKN